MKLVTLPAGSLTDIPKLLRILADKIESGDLDDATAVAIVVESDSTKQIDVFGFGPAVPYTYAIGMLYRGANFLCSGIVGR
jgi:hypothetical protein